MIPLKVSKEIGSYSDGVEGASIVADDLEEAGGLTIGYLHQSSEAGDHRDGPPQQDAVEADAADGADAGLTGLETAEKLADDGNRVMVVEMEKEIGPGAYHQNLDDVLLHLKRHNPVFITSHKLVEIREGEIVLEHVKSGSRAIRQVDQVVLSVGARSEDTLAAELKGLKARFPRVLVIGDAREPGRIANAVKDGFDIAWNL